MSHIVTIQTEIRDLQALRAACDRLQVAAPVYQKNARLFRKQVADWLYPVASVVPI